MTVPPEAMIGSNEPLSAATVACHLDRVCPSASRKRAV